MCIFKMLKMVVPSRVELLTHPCQGYVITVSPRNYIRDSILYNKLWFKCQRKKYLYVYECIKFKITAESKDRRLLSHYNSAYFTSDNTFMEIIVSGLITSPLFPVPFLILSTNSIPDTTCPQTVYCPSKNPASLKQIKN